MQGVGVGDQGAERRRQNAGRVGVQAIWPIWRGHPDDDELPFLDPGFRLVGGIVDLAVSRPSRRRLQAPAILWQGLGGRAPDPSRKDGVTGPRGGFPNSLAAVV